MGIEKVRGYFRAHGMEDRVREFEVSSATVELAAEAVGVPGAQICKTLSFKRKEGGAILVQMAGDAKVDNKKFKSVFQEKAKFLTPEEVFYYTGYEIGGVCAFAITREEVEIYCDESLRRFEKVFPACGTANSAAELSCDELFALSKASAWVDVAKLPEEN